MKQFLKMKYPPKKKNNNAQINKEIHEINNFFIVLSLIV